MADRRGVRLILWIVTGLTILCLAGLGLMAAIVPDPPTESQQAVMRVLDDGWMAGSMAIFACLGHLWGAHGGHYLSSLAGKVAAPKGASKRGPRKGPQSGARAVRERRGKRRHRRGVASAGDMPEAQ